MKLNIAVLWDLFDTLMERIAGKNWYTTVGGWLAGLSFFFVANALLDPQSLVELGIPQIWVDKTVKLVTMIGTAAIIFQGTKAKDSDVTGGTTAQTVEATARTGEPETVVEPPDPPAPKSQLVSHLVCALLALGIMFSLSACAVLMPSYSGLGADATPEQKAAAIRQDVRRYLESKATQNAVKDVVVRAGKKVIRESEDQKQAADFAGRASTASAMLAGMTQGQVFTEDSLEDLVFVFGSNDEVVKRYAPFVQAINAAWLMVYPQLEQLKDLDLIHVYLGILSDALRDVAAEYFSQSATVTPSAESGESGK